MSGARALPSPRRLAIAPLVLLLVLGVCCGGPGPATAEPVRVRFAEGPSHGFFTLSDAASGKKLAHGELVQWMEKRVVASRLLIRFDDGSLYDETVRFTQRPSFRITSYELTQKGPSFDEDQRVKLDASGKYDVRQQKHPPVVRMRIAPAPVLVRFEGALYVDGPQWRMDLAAPRWKK